jgi:hypothetical protein
MPNIGFEQPQKHRYDVAHAREPAKKSNPPFFALNFLMPLFEFGLRNAQVFFNPF